MQDNENIKSSTQQFVDSFSTPSLSDMAKTIQNQSQDVTLQYNTNQNNNFQNDLQIAQNYGQPAQYQAVAEKKVNNTQDQNSIDTDQILEKAHKVSKTAYEREKILKNEYLKASEKAALHEKELILKDLKIAETLYEKAIEDQDASLQSQMQTAQIELRNRLLEHDIKQKEFQKKSKDLLEDELEVIDYTPTYEESDESEYENPVRQQFRKANAWYDYDSPNYNPDLVEEAEQIEKAMRKEYQLKNMSNYIESVDYFNDLKSRIYRKNGISDESNYMNNPMNDVNVYQQQPQSHPQTVAAPAPNPFIQPQNNNFQNNQPGFMGAPQNPFMQNVGNFQNNPGITSAPSYGPPVAPVSHGRPAPNISPANSEMYSQRAFEIFVNSLNPTLAPQLSKLDHNQKMQLFQAAIKNKGVI